MRAEILALVFALGVVPSAYAQEPLLRPIGTDEAKLSVWGWVWSNDERPLDMVRLRAKVETDSPWGLFVEADVSEGVELRDNWLRQGIVTYKAPSGSYDLSIGRLFLAAPRATPPPFLLRTSRFMRYPFPFYGWGAQVHRKDGPFDLTWDVSTNSRSRFNDGDTLDGLESSARLTYDVNETLQVGSTVQVTEGTQRFAVESTWKPDSMSRLNAVAYTTVGDQELSGGYVLYTYQPKPWVEIHGQLDYQDGAKIELLQTIGARFIYDRFQVVVDHELTDDTTFVRLQTSF